MFGKKDSNIIQQTKIIDNTLKTNTIDTIQNISAKFEEIKKNPTDYPEHIRESITREYKDIIEGNTKDPNAIHAPSERKGSYVNEDYLKYLRNQIKALGPDSWHAKEYKRVKRIDQEDTVKLDFIFDLIKMGAKRYYTNAMVSEQRIENYSPEDWKELIILTNYWEEDLKYHPGTIIGYLENIEDMDTLFDSDKLEMFKKITEYDIPEKIAAVIVTTNMTDTEIEQILYALEQGFTIDQAISDVLIEKKREIETKIALKQMENILK